MTPEMAEYCRAMLLVGIRDKLDQAFDRALETEEPLSDLILSLSTCISDDEQVLRVLREYTLDHSYDPQTVCSLIREDVRARLLAGEMTRAQAAEILYRIVMNLDRFREDPWHGLTEAEYDLELFEDGLISGEVFNRCFDAWFFEQKRLDAWELQRNLANTEEKKTMKNEKLTNILLWVLPAVAAVLNALPWCVRMQFAAGPDETFFEYFSGYSLIPAGYGVWSHMLAGVFGAVLLVMGLFHVRSESPRLRKWMLTVSIVALLMAVTPLAFGTATAISTLVALALGAEAAILYRMSEDN